MHVKRNTETWSCKYCCSGQTISIAYCVCVCVCVFVALVFHHAMRMRHIVTWGLSGSFCILSHYLTNGAIFRKLLNIQNVFWFFLQLLSETFLILRTTERDMIKMYIDLHVKYPLFLSDFNDTLIFWKDFRKYSNMKLHENPSSGSRVVSCGRQDRQTDMTKLMVAFRNFANAPKKIHLLTQCICVFHTILSTNLLVPSSTSIF
jgi:hypothetical protein